MKDFSPEAMAALEAATITDIEYHDIDVIRPGSLDVTRVPGLQGEPKRLPNYTQQNDPCLDFDHPDIIELGRRMIREGKRQEASEPDAYRELLEARVGGMEAMLTALVRQAQADTTGKTFDRALVMRALRYLAGNGTL